MRRCLLICFVASASIGGLVSSEAQTTLAGDHVVNGALTGGTASNKSRVVINGETGSSATPGLSIFGDGGVSFEGTFGQGGIPASGAGSRMIWYPGKAAFRAGKFDYVSDSDIGTNSTAFNGATAAGENSLGACNGMVFGSNSVSFNGYCLGDNSAAFPVSTSVGDYSFSAANGYALGSYSVAFDGYAGGVRSIAFQRGTADTDYSIAFAGWASGYYSVAFGPGSAARSAYSFVIGRNADNLDQSSNSWRDQDELFVVGNGTGKPSDPPEVQNRNALVVYKSGKIKMDRQGDILMGEFGNPE